MKCVAETCDLPSYALILNISFRCPRSLGSVARVRAFWDIHVSIARRDVFCPTFFERNRAGNIHHYKVEYRIEIIFLEVLKRSLPL